MAADFSVASCLFNVAAVSVASYLFTVAAGCFLCGLLRLQCDCRLFSLPPVFSLSVSRACSPFGHPFYMAVDTASLQDSASHYHFHCFSFTGIKKRKKKREEDKSSITSRGVSHGHMSVEREEVKKLFVNLMSV